MDVKRREDIGIGNTTHGSQRTMGQGWSLTETDECDRCLGFVDRLMVEQEVNMDRMEEEITDLERAYTRYTNEHEKLVTLAVIARHRAACNQMFTHLAQLRESRMRLRLLRSKFQDKELIRRESALLDRIKDSIRTTERSMIENEMMTERVTEGIELPLPSEPSTEEMLELRVEMLRREQYIPPREPVYFLSD